VITLTGYSDSHGWPRVTISGEDLALIGWALDLAAATTVSAQRREQALDVSRRLSTITDAQMHALEAEQELVIIKFQPFCTTCTWLGHHYGDEGDAWTAGNQHLIHVDDDHHHQIEIVTVP
jgi:hypothetical protein